MSTIKVNKIENTSTTDGGVSIDTQGRVGVGDNAPNSTLTIKDAAGITPLQISGPSSEFCRIDSSGRLLVGTSTGSGSNTNLEVDGGVIANGSHVESIAGSSSFDKKITFAQKGAILVNINFCLGPTTSDSTRNIYSVGLMIPFNGGTLYVPIQADLTSSHVGNFTISSGGATGVLRIQKSAGSDARQCTFRVDCLSTADVNVAVADF